jgi:ribonuclease D
MGERYAIINMSSQMGDNALNLPDRADPGTFEFVGNPGALRQVWLGLREAAGALALDLETYGNQAAEALDPFRGEIRLLTAMVPGGRSVIFDLKALGYRTVDWPGLFAGRDVIGHNLHFDAAWLLEKLGVRLPQMFCTWSAAKLLSNGDQRASNALGPVLERFLGVAVPKALGVSDWGSLMLTEGQLDYAARDVMHLHALKDKLADALRVAGLDATFELEMALLPVVVDI